MQRLFPNPVGMLSVDEAYGVARNRVATPNGNTRPTIGMCMVMSIDGSTVVDGNSRALGGPADLAVLLGLRKLADVIIVGASTVVVDDYGPPSKPGLRVGVVTRSATINTNTPLFASGSGFLITTETAAAPADVECVRAGTTTVDLAQAVQQLQGNFAQLEGGPTLNAAMVEADLVDEINVTVSPNIVGGLGPRLTAGATDVLQRFSLAHVCEEDGFLFLRYTR
jgi:5-amino-6-(5-phosphoribosylamino)uracil reductase